MHSRFVADAGVDIHQNLLNVGPIGRAHIFGNDANKLTGEPVERLQCPLHHTCAKVSSEATADTVPQGSHSLRVGHWRRPVVVIYEESILPIEACSLTLSSRRELSSGGLLPGTHEEIRSSHTSGSASRRE